MVKTITYIGLDVHKDTIAVALADAGLRGEVREYGKFANTPAAMKTLTSKLTPRGGELRFCTKPARAAMASSGNLPALGTNVWWSRRR